MQRLNDKVQLFEDRPIRTVWVEDEEEWYFSIVDVVRVLTEQPNTDDARNYWKVLKNRIKEQGNELVTNCNRLKMKAKDGKMRLTDVANTEQLLRIIQSIPSKKAEPFKMWLAHVGRERIEEVIDPGSFEENRKVAIKGGEAAGEARLAVEKRTGKLVITNKNATQLQDLVTGLIETVNDKQKKYIIRNMRKSEIILLKDFLYEAIFIPEGVEPPERDIVERPELRVYTDDFGSRKGDNCLVADFGGKVVGAVWTRIMDDYGHVDDETPSFAISLYKEYRGQGIGSQLMVKMLELLKRQGYEKASLAVQKANYAVKMYKNVGFKTVDENDEEYIMVCEL